MRTMFLLPLALAAAAAASGCGTASEGTEQASLRVPRRDLTLQNAAVAQVEVASPVELASTPIQRSTVHHPRRARRPSPAPSPQSTGSGAAAAPVLDLTAAQHAPLAMSTAPAPADPHELAPGQSVTVIPVSSDPSTVPDWTDEHPSDGGRGIAVGTDGHGGGCRGGGGSGMGGSGMGGSGMGGSGDGGGGFRGLR